MTLLDLSGGVSALLVGDCSSVVVVMVPEYREYVVFVPRIFHIHTDFSYF